MKRSLRVIRPIVFLAMAGLFHAAHGVTLSLDGRGQVLIFPYYAARSGFDTLLSIANTQGQPKAVKVSFYEGKRGVPVFRFNLYLSAHDVWTAAVTAGPGGAATLITDDTSCTSPQLGRSNPPFSPLVPNFGDDGESNEPSRTAEGHVEVVEMGEVSDLIISQAPPLTFAQAVTHTSGRPPGCLLVASITSSGGNLWQASAPTFGLNRPRGGLTGTMSLINVLEGIDYTVDALALSALRNAAMHTFPEDSHPSLGDAQPRESIYFNDDGTAVRSTWNGASANGADPVTALLMASAVFNEFVLDPVIHASTDWVVTLPTRRFYGGLGNVAQPFFKPFQRGGACEPVLNNLFDREERSQVVGYGTVGVPPPTDARFTSLCWVSNVLSFNDSRALGGSALSPKDSPSSVFASGQSSLEATSPVLGLMSPPFDPSVRRLTDDVGQTYRGLPMIGFAVQKYVNGNLGGVQANYGGNFPHRYDRAR